LGGVFSIICGRPKGLVWRSSYTHELLGLRPQTGSIPEAVIGRLLLPGASSNVRQRAA
jgi:hypothetical protein